MKTSARWTSLGPAVATALLFFGTWAVPGRCAERASADPSTVLWYAHPADKWENAFPVGNGRLGAMVFGKTDEEEIQLNEETYWSGGPYS
ncbi:MAG: glycoside hydrolase N-terminal domain-containing protein, partial [Candidatus Aminicenantes bacterium]|nr:glycoside hydrolase N-terminal domain-containing protein [Candidatus Aminicenantes bacterium]